MKIRFLASPHKASASNRIRMMVPSEGFKKLKFDGGFGFDVDNDTVSVISKTKTNLLSRVGNSKLIWDVCDNYFSDGRVGQAIQLLKRCDAVTTTTQSLKKEIKSQLKKIGRDVPIHIVDDPVFYDLLPPSFNIDDEGKVEGINIVWYGYDGNLKYGDWDKHVFEPLSKLNYKFNFKFINKNGTLPPGNRKHNIISKSIPFNTDNQEKHTRKADFVILCIDHTHPFTKGKSHNKLVDGLACGTMVLASPQESYTRFSEYAMIGNNFAENIEWCIDNQIETLNRIKEGQDYIKEHLTDVAVAKQWIRVAEETL